MGLRDKVQSKKKPLSKKAGVNSNLNKLSEDELRILLNLVKQTTFKGENIEPMYNLVKKLQNQFEDWLK